MIFDHNKSVAPMLLISRNRYKSRADWEVMLPYRHYGIPQSFTINSPWSAHYETHHSLGSAVGRAFRAKAKVKAYKDLPIYVETAPYQGIWTVGLREYQLLESELDAVALILTQDSK